jgi:hypothetical protein
MIKRWLELRKIRKKLELGNFTHARFLQAHTSGMMDWRVFSLINCAKCGAIGECDAFKISIRDTAVVNGQEIVTDQMGPDMWYSAISGKCYCSNCLGINYR